MNSFIAGILLGIISTVLLEAIVILYTMKQMIDAVSKDERR